MIQHKMPRPGFEPGLLRPQRRVLTTRRPRLVQLTDVQLKIAHRIFKFNYVADKGASFRHQSERLKIKFHSEGLFIPLLLGSVYIKAKQLRKSSESIINEKT